MGRGSQQQAIEFEGKLWTRRELWTRFGLTTPEARRLFGLRLQVGWSPVRAATAAVQRKGSKAYQKALRTWQMLVAKAPVTVVDEWLDFEIFLADIGEPRRNERLHNSEPDELHGPTNTAWVKKKNLVDFDGALWTFAELAAYFGLPERALRTRIQQRGWPIIRALWEPFQDSVERHAVHLLDGKKYTIAGLAKLSGVHCRTLSKRLAKGMTPEEATRAPVQNCGLHVVAEKQKKAKATREARRGFYGRRSNKPTRQELLERDLLKRMRDR